MTICWKILKNTGRSNIFLSEISKIPRIFFCWDEKNRLNMLFLSPHLIKAPIALYKDNTIVCNTPSH